jgi:membrane-associated phospholipid phosphatase
MVGIWTLLADIINPILAVTGLICAALSIRHGRTFRFWVLNFAAISLAVALAEFGKWLPIWPGHPEFPSGHETLGVGISACLVLYRKQWVWVVVPICVLLGVSLVGAHFHRPIEVIGGVGVGSFPPFLIYRVWNKMNLRHETRNIVI